LTTSTIQTFGYITNTHIYNIFKDIFTNIQIYHKDIYLRDIYRKYYKHSDILQIRIFTIYLQIYLQTFRYITDTYIYKILYHRYIYLQDIYRHIYKHSDILQKRIFTIYSQIYLQTFSKNYIGHPTSHSSFKIRD